MVVGILALHVTALAADRDLGHIYHPLDQQLLAKFLWTLNISLSEARKVKLSDFRHQQLGHKQWIGHSCDSCRVKLRLELSHQKDQLVTA
jgi:hypothetical protein